MEPSNEKELKSPKKLGTRHTVSVFLFLMQGIAFGTRASMSVAIVAMTDTKSGNPDFPVFDWDSEKTSLILSSLLWGCIIVQMPIGYLTSNGGSQKLLCIGSLLAGVSSMLTPVLATNCGWIAVVCCRVVMGLSQGCVTPCVYKILSSWAPPPERARLGSFVLNGAQLGTVVLMSLSGVLADSSLGWPGIFYIFGLVSIVWAILFYFLGADTPSEHSRICPKEAHYINSHLDKLDKDTLAQNPEFPWKAIVKSVPVWSLFITSCGQGWCYYVFLNGLPSYMKHVLNFDIQKSGGMSALPYLLMWLLGFPFSWISDFALRKGVPVTLSRKICNVIGMWAPALALVALCLIQTDNEAIYVMIFVLAVGFNAAITCGSEINQIDIAPNFSGTLVSITNTGAKCCGIVSPIVCGYIVTDMSNVDQWHIVFYITALIYFLTNLNFLLFGTAEKQPWNDEIPPQSPFNNEAAKLSIISAGYHGEFKNNVKNR